MDRRQPSAFDRIVLVAAAISGSLALIIQLILIYITSNLVNEINRLTDEHHHINQQHVRDFQRCNEPKP
jgi:hypothetical protein